METKFRASAIVIGLLAASSLLADQPESHWAFQPISRPAVPEIKNSSWAQNPIDAFIGQRHEALGISPNAEADSVTLQRRLALDLVGFPMTLEAGTYEELVEQLLASPHYGERWGRHWLDVARWAESNGHQHNRDRPHAWRYRDYVIESFNSDLPFDQFIREQIAGDELPEYSDRHLIATGFLAAARYSGNELDKEIQRNDILVDITNTTSKAFLGLTMECAQCHDHEFDPITIDDYYAMQAFFAKGQPGDVILEAESPPFELVEQRWELFEGVRFRLIARQRNQGVVEPNVIPKSVVKGMTKEEAATLKDLDSAIARYSRVWAFYSPIDAGTSLAIAPHEMRWPLQRDAEFLEGFEVHLLDRGDVKSPEEVKKPAWPQLLGKTPEISEKPRLALANWLGSPGNPLTARVWANRVWQWHFGRGLVPSSGDFGANGEPPSHPELLDWLASELIESGWSTKHLHRLILGSSTYRQSSIFQKRSAAVDPENHALWRWYPKRLEAEAIRDSILAVSGKLDLKSGGPSVSSGSYRRSVYLKQKRDNLPHQQSLFDGANAMTSCSKRSVSTVSLQPLWLLNGEVTLKAAADIAQEVEGGAMPVSELFKRVLGRRATAEEIRVSKAFVEQSGLESLAMSLLNSNEFLYIP